MQKTMRRTLLGLAVLLVLFGWYALIMRPWPNPASMTFDEWRAMRKAQEQDGQIDRDDRHAPGAEPA